MITIMRDDRNSVLSLPRGKLRHLAAGEALFVSGDHAVGLVHVLCGMLELRRAGATGQEPVIQRAGPGESLGEASIFEPRHHCDAVATLEASVEVLSPAAFRRAAASDPAVVMHLARLLTSRLVQARARAEWLALPKAQDRLMAALHARPVDPDGVRMVGGTWRSLAAECALTAEATYRSLARLERAGRLRRLLTPQGVGAVLL